MTATSAVLTLLFTDIEGSTSLWEQEAKEMEAAVAIHFELLQRVITSHHGNVVKQTGDGVFATFSDPLEAVAGGGCGAARARRDGLARERDPGADGLAHGQLLCS